MDKAYVSGAAFPSWHIEDAQPHADGNHAVTRFYLSCLLAFTAGHMVNYTVILYLQETVGSDLLSGIGFGLSFGSSLLFGWFAGVLCDRVAPHRVIQSAQTLFVVCLALLWWTDAQADASTRVALVMLAALFSGLGWSFVGPARLAALGQLADPARLKPATILFNVQVMLGFGLAPIVLAVQRHLRWLALGVCHRHAAVCRFGPHAAGHPHPMRRKSRSRAPRGTCSTVLPSLLVHRCCANCCWLRSSPMP